MYCNVVLQTQDGAFVLSGPYSHILSHIAYIRDKISRMHAICDSTVDYSPVCAVLV